MKGKSKRHRWNESQNSLFSFCNFIKKSKEKKIERIFAKNFARNHEKKIILGTSDAWSTIRLSHRPSNPAYYIVNWRILWRELTSNRWWFWCESRILFWYTSYITLYYMSQHLRKLEWCSTRKNCCGTHSELLKNDSLL